MICRLPFRSHIVAVLLTTALAVALFAPRVSAMPETAAAALDTQHYRIGDFAALSRVSIRTLRHYDAIGLFAPAHTDPFTRYRYYTLDQLPRLHQIVAFKAMGFALADIPALLDADAPDLYAALAGRHADLVGARRLLEAQIARVGAWLAQRDAAQTEDSPMTAVDYTFTLKPLSALLPLPEPPESGDVLMFQVNVPPPSGEQTDVIVFVQRLDVNPGDAPRVEPLPPLPGADASIQPFAPGAQPFTLSLAPEDAAPSADSLIFVIDETAQPDAVASLVTHGRAHLPAAYRALGDWIAQQGYAIAGSPREARRDDGTLELHIPVITTPAHRTD